MKHVYLNLAYAKRKKETFERALLVFSLTLIPKANIVCLCLAMMLNFLYHIKIQNLYFK